jgi:hypothetical protein
MNGADQLVDAAKQLADAVDDSLTRWVVGAVERVYRAWSNGPLPPEVAAAATEAGRLAQATVGGRVRKLLEADIDEQRTTPLSVLRTAVAFPTAVLRGAGVPDVQRDAVAEEMFPDDPYGLTPASFADIDPSLHELGLRWGAAKAWTHKRRHGADAG